MHRSVECCFPPARALYFGAPAEEHVLRSRTRCTLAPPVGENPGQRAANVYSVGETTYSAPKYCASVGDALKKLFLGGCLKKISPCPRYNYFIYPQQSHRKKILLAQSYVYEAKIIKYRYTLKKLCLGDFLKKITTVSCGKSQ
jgi:hypothetical protein